MKRGLTLLAILAAPLAAYADPVSVVPRTMLHQMANPAPVPAVVNSHILYLNPCLPNGCALTNNGTTDSTQHSSDIVNCCGEGSCTGGNATLGKFPNSTATWNSMKSCVQKVMAPFNVQITDVDPGNVPHFEVMVGGSPGDIGCPNGVGGIADIPQGSYIPNAIVFNFADVWQGDVQFLCQTTAQEIAHAWNMDHVVDSKDPMTYNFGFTGQWSYHDGEVCGSDCVDQGNGQLVSPLGQACTGTNPATATHPCFGTGGKQDEIKAITALFGPSNAAPVTAKITSPKNGDGVSPNFEIDVSCTSTDPIQEADLYIDGQQVGSATSAPYTFHGGSSLKNGSHTLLAQCTSTSQAQGMDQITITQGITCNGNSDCPNSTDVCANHICVAGGSAPGGLGTSCKTNADCVSGECGSDGTDSFCVVGCDTSADGCPSGFGCLSTGAGTAGVCWPGADNGGGDGGGCQSQSGGGGPAMILLGLGFAGIILVRKRV